jgi:hypothetical protein
MIRGFLFQAHTKRVNGRDNSVILFPVLYIELTYAAGTHRDRR